MGFFDTVWLHLRDGARALARRPVLSALAVLALAACFGANAALFSIVDAVLLRPLPFARQDRLMILWERNDSAPFVEVSHPDFVDWRARTASFSSLAAMPAVNQVFRWDAPEGAVNVRGRLVSGSFFEVLGARAALGRTLRAEDDRAGAPRVLVLGHGFWRRALGGDPGAVGRSLIVEGTPFVVVGVMPAEFGFPAQAELWTPIVPAQPQIVENRAVCWTLVLGRLSDGVSREQAHAEMDGIVQGLAKAHRGTFGADSRAVVTPLVDHLVGDSRRMLLVLLAAVGLVLVMACVNVGALQLARAVSREREMALRLALGSSRRRLAAGLVTEAGLLVALGATLGLVAARAGLPALLAMVPAEVPRLQDAALDPRAFGFTMALAGLAVLIAGLWPAQRATRAALSGMLKEAGRGASEGTGARRLRRALIATEMAVAVTVLAAAGVVARSFLNLSRVDLGYDPRGVLAMEIEASDSTHPDRAAKLEFQRRLLERVRALPGVQEASWILLRPLWGTVGMDWPFTVEGQAADEASRNPLLNLEAVTPGYFRTLRIPLERGRDFTEHDRQGAPGVVIVSRSFARRYWPAADPLGKRLKIPLPDSPYHYAWLTVVGVAADARYRELQAARFDLYMSYLQSDATLHHLMVRSEGELGALASRVRAEARALDPQHAPGEAAAMEDLLHRSLAAPRFSTQVFGAFALLALLLAAAGTYGVVADSVGRRTREIGVRMALGARAADVLRLVVGQAMLPTLAGLGAGLLLALALGRLVAGLLFGVTAADPATLAGVAGVLILTALLSSLGPALRAAGVSPVEALRQD